MWFTFAVTSWHARQNFARQHLVRAQAATEPAEAFVSRVVLSLFWGGADGLVEDHNVGRTMYSTRNRGNKHTNTHTHTMAEHTREQDTSYCKYVLFVSTVPIILTEFSFGIGMVITEKYRPIPTEKYRFGMQLLL